MNPATSGHAPTLPPRLSRPLPAQVWALASWPFLQQLLTWLVHFVDTAVAGRLSVEATNAVAVAAYFGWFIVLMTMAVGTGGAALIARSIGADRRGPANAALGQTVLLAAVWSVLVGGGIFLAADGLAAVAKLDPQSRVLAAGYLRVIGLATPLSAAMFIGTATLSAAGDTRTPFLIMLVYNAVNIVATLALAVGDAAVPLPGGGQWAVRGLGMGVAGIAWGTALASAAGGGLMLAALLRRGAAVRLRVRRLRPRPALIRRVVAVAWPTLGEGLSHWIGNFVILVVVGHIALELGATGYQGAHIVAIRIESLSFLPAMALGTAAATLVGQFLGAGRPDLAQRAAWWCWGVAAALMTPLGVAFVAAPQWWCRLMTHEAVLIELAAPLVQICGLIQLFFGTQIVLGAALRGAGDTRRPLVITTVLTWAVRLPAVVVLGWWMGMGLTGVWLGLCGELLVRGVVFAMVFARGRWKLLEV